jgi:ssDNA thymidine ADP-ribosyltransferase, DarT
MINKDKSFCYRICHIENVPEILQNGLCTKHHPNASKNFVGIGNPDIIDLRDDTPVKIHGYGNIGDYVPFYFTPKSMMLYNIITGYRAPLVPKRNREDIVVFRCLIVDLSKSDKFFFSDGQANVTSITEHYNDLKHLDKIDWEIIHKSDFKNEAGDTDKQRRYQAEFLVHSHVPIERVESINVYNEKASDFVKREIAKTDLLIPVNIIPNYFF